MSVERQNTGRAGNAGEVKITAGNAPWEECGAHWTEYPTSQS